MKAKVILYDNISEKNSLLDYTWTPLSDEEALIRALDLLDFNAAISSQNDARPNQSNDTIEWIELNWIKK